MIKNYYTLTKPGIIYGNAIVALGGFFLASAGNIDLLLLVMTIVGLSLVIASSCVLNNYIDRDIDGYMERTKERALVRGTVPVKNAIIFAVFLGLLGICILYLYASTLALLIALIGAFFYVVVYSLWSKRQTVYGTLVGSISGAIPPVVGYVAVTGTLDAGAVILFIILCMWQMPHFYAITIYRYEDYAAAGVPVLPRINGIRETKIHISLYIIGLMFAIYALYAYQYTGAAYLVIMGVLCVIWLFMSLMGFKHKDVVGDVANKKWARGVFLFSLVIIIVFSLTISIGV